MPQHAARPSLGALIAAAALGALAPLSARPQVVQGDVVIQQADNLANDARESTQNVTVNDSPEARKDIDTAHGMERQKEWLKAAGWYQQVLEKYRTRVVAWKANDQNVIDRYRGIVYEVQQSLAKWPPEGVTAYRSRYESSAAQALAAAGSDDLIALNNVLETYFITEAGKTAGMKLIDLHMEAGEFDAAARVGELLLSYYPPSHLLVERPRILFHTALAHHFCGDDKLAQARADELKQKFADATGSIFGKDVTLAKSIDDLLKAAPAVAQSNAPDSWSMFSGSPDRSRVSAAIGHMGARIARIEFFPRRAAAQPAAPYIQNGPMFNGRFVNPNVEGQTQSDEDHGMLLGVMPVVDNGELFFQDGAHVWARSLDSGFPLVGWSQTYPGNDNAQGVYQLRNPGGNFNPSVHGGQYTLTLTDTAVLGILGQPSRVPVAFDQNGNPLAAASDAGTRLICLDRKNGQERWKVSPTTLTGETLKDDDRDRLRALDLSGSPLIVGDNVFVIGRGGKDAQFENCYVLCFDLNSGKYRWSCLVASANSQAGGFPNGGEFPTSASTLSHLAYTGGRIYVNTNLGALAAIDAYNGSIVWLSLYRRDNAIANNIAIQMNRPRAFFTQQLVQRPWEYNPVFAQDGKLFVLPTDSKYLLVFDVATGQELKAIDLGEFQPQSAENDVPTLDQPRALIAVVDGMAVLTGSEHIYTVKWATYDTKKSFLDNVPASALYSTLGPITHIRGRAFASADSVVVTTDKALFKLNLRKGLLAIDSYPTGRQEWDESEGPGNIVATGDHVIIATSRSVNVYTDLALAQAKHDKAIQAAPNDVAPRLDYAKVMFAAGHLSVALQKLNDAVGLIGGVANMHPGPDRQQIFNDAWNFAQRLAQDKRGESNEAAVKFFDVAAAAADLPKEQVEYRLFRAKFCRDNRDAHSLELAVQLYQEILLHPDWRMVSVPSPEDGSSTTLLPAGTIAQRQVADVKSKHPEAYAAQEKKAAEATDAATAQADAAKLLAVAQDYPNSDAAPRALLAAAELDEKSSDPRHATHVLRALYRDYSEAAGKPPVIEAMVRNYLALPGGLDIAIARLQRAKDFADTRLTQPLKLPDGQTLTDATFKEALLAITKLREADKGEPLVDLRVPDRHEPGGVSLPPFLAATDPKCVTIKDVTALLQAEESPNIGARHDRVIAATANNKVAIFAAGRADALGASEFVADAPLHAIWMRGEEKSSNAIAWGHDRIAALDGDTAESHWTATLKSFPADNLAGGTATDGIEVAYDTLPGRDEAVTNNINVRNFQRRAIRANNFGRPQIVALVPVEEQPLAPNAPEQIRHVCANSEHVFVGTSAGRVLCLNAKDGKLAWQAKVGAHAIDKLLTSEDFCVIRTTEDGSVRLITLDNFDGRVQAPVRSFVAATGVVPQNMALSAGGMLVWTMPDRLCGKDLYEPGKTLTFEYPPQGAAVQQAPDINMNGINRQFNGGMTNPALIFAGCTRDSQLMIYRDRILAVEMSGAFVVAHSIETGRPLTHLDKTGKEVETKLNTIGGTSIAPGSAEVNISLSTAGPYLYVVGPRSLICYNIDHPALDQWFADPSLTGNPNFQFAVPTKTELLVVAEPAKRRNADDLGAAIKQLRLYNRRQIKEVNDSKDMVESGSVDFIHNISDPSGIKSWQIVDGGIYYLTGDQTLHFLAGSKS